MAAMFANIHEAFYKNEALFSDTKVTSVYSQSFEGTDVEMINQ
jgi:hypothetical protein